MSGTCFEQLPLEVLLVVWPRTDPAADRGNPVRMPQTLRPQTSTPQDPLHLSRQVLKHILVGSYCKAHIGII